MNWRNTGILVIVLVVPLALLLIFKTGTTRLNQLPIYGEKTFVNGDSIDYKVDLNKIIDLPSSTAHKHILVYFSLDSDNSIKGDAVENLGNLALRLQRARNHPSRAVEDVIIVSISNSHSALDSLSVFYNIAPKSDIAEFVKDELQNSFEFSKNPIEDHVAFLIDKDKRLRSMYYTGHGKFDQNILGELVVLRFEYGE